MLDSRPPGPSVQAQHLATCSLVRNTVLQILIQQGQTAAGLFIVVSGSCNCYINDPLADAGLRLVQVVLA
jgi:hypothetical protein